MYRFRVLSTFLVVASIALLASVTRADNVLIIVADDVGVDMIGIYGEGLGLDPSPTPNLDGYAGDAVLFKNVWSNPTCSPTRATVQTGRYGYNTGVLSPTFGIPTFSTNRFELPLCELTLPKMLDKAALGHNHAAIGKWHLGNQYNGDDLENGNDRSPNLAGYDHFAGTRQNIFDYENWTYVVNGVLQGQETTYATTKNVDDALAWINSQQGNPWVVWLAFNAPHSPWHMPADPNLHPDFILDPNGDCVDDDPNTFLEDDDDRQCYLAMLQALDSEVKRLIDGLPGPVLDQTTFVFLGDNGSFRALQLPPFTANPGKFFLFEGGINVPLIIWGSGVTVDDGNPGSPIVSEELVNTTDLFATVLDLATGQTPEQIEPNILVPLNSQSLVPILTGTQSGVFRDFVYAERTFDAAIRNDRYKLFADIDRSTNQLTHKRFHDLKLDEFEVDNLFEPIDPNNPPTCGVLTGVRKNNCDALEQAMLNLLAQTADGGCDLDGVSQHEDICRSVYDPGQVAIDADLDAVFDACDNCPTIYNLSQLDTDVDGFGDTCDDCDLDPNIGVDSELPAVEVLNPNGGEVLIIGNPRLLTWSASDNCRVESIDLLLSRNGSGGPFADTIASGIANTGSYSWTVTGPETDHGVLKVVAQDEAGNTAEDISNGEFSIVDGNCEPCQASYCGNEGIRCFYAGTCGFGGCCNYTCSDDPTCIAPDLCPVNACGC